MMGVVIGAWFVLRERHPHITKAEAQVPTWRQQTSEKIEQ
jgi:hypothetical protein